MVTFITRLTPTAGGIRLAVKDLIDIAGVPTTAGCRAVADTATAATADAACLAGARAATAGIVGKANLHELGYLNLTGVSRLETARRYRKLTEAEEHELATAVPRDEAAARWYAWVQVAGLALAAFYFVAFFAPAAVQLIRWVITGLTGSPAGSLRFWEALVSGCVAALPVVIPPLTYLRDRRRRGRAQRRPAGPSPG
jgi:hypothetical protein